MTSQQGYIYCWASPVASVDAETSLKVGPVTVVTAASNSYKFNECLEINTYKNYFKSSSFEKQIEIAFKILNIFIKIQEVHLVSLTY